MIAIFKFQDQSTNDLLSYISSFFKEEIQPVYWGDNFNSVEYEKALADVQKEEISTDKSTIQSIFMADYVDKKALKRIISDIEQSSQSLPPLVFDQATWSLFQPNISVIPIITSLKDNNYDEVRMVIEQSPTVYFINQEDYITFRDEYINTTWLCHSNMKQKSNLSSSLFRISRQTDYIKLFKGLALTQRLKKMNLPIRGIVCDEENPEMLLLIHSYFPKLPVIAIEDVNLQRDLSLYLYQPSKQMMKQLKCSLFFGSSYSSSKNVGFFNIDISNRDLDTIEMLIKDSKVNVDKYHLISNQDQFEKSWFKALDRYSDEKIFMNEIVEITKLDETKIKLNGYMLFDKSIEHKEVSLQVMLVHKSTGNAFSVATTFQIESEKICYSAEIDFKELDFFKGKFAVVVFYDSWNLQIQKKATFENNFTGEPITSLFVFSRNIEALVDSEENLFFRVSTYKID